MPEENEKQEVSTTENVQPEKKKIKFFWLRFIVALCIALAVDITFVFITPAEGLEVFLDGIIGAVLCFLLGFNISVIPAFFLEAIPGVDILPFWTLTVLYMGGKIYMEQKKSK